MILDENCKADEQLFPEQTSESRSTMTGAASSVDGERRLLDITIDGIIINRPIAAAS